MPGGEVTQPRDVSGRQSFQVAQHQRDDLVAHREFDLRQPVALGHARDQLAQRHQQVAHHLRHHLAALHVGHIAALALVEADQHLALLGHVADRKTRTVAVAPGRAFDRPQQHLGLDLAEMPELVLNHALLHGHLRPGLQMLHLAAPAGARVQAEMRAARRHPQRAFLLDLGELALLPVVLAPCNLRLDDLARQGTVDEHHLAVGVVRHALRLKFDAFDLEPIRCLSHPRIIRAQAWRPSTAGHVDRTEQPCAGQRPGPQPIFARLGPRPQRPGFRTASPGRRRGAPCCA
mmetsp:Transcript_53296/g.125193  ORF Transcript_53296/g.125193 Transcript_53296/m.125193 type:complete len:290 (+) Transcript_53296:1107-1976(+)